MADAAYSVFFAAVLIGGASFLHLSLRRDWQRIAAALRGDMPEVIFLPASAGTVTSWERTHPILQPVEISICRI